MRPIRNKKPVAGSGISAAALIAGLLVMFATASHAQPSANELLDSLRNCQTITAMPARLACYDSILPPPETNTGTAEQSLSDSDSQIEEIGSPAVSNTSPVMSGDETVRAAGNELLITRVDRPAFSTFRYISEDGRVFVQSNSRSLPRLPDTPFEAELESGRFTTTLYLVIPASGQRFRVVQE